MLKITRDVFLIKEATNILCLGCIYGQDLSE